MSVMYKVLPVLLLVAITWSRSVNDDVPDLDTLIDEVFGKTPNQGTTENKGATCVQENGEKGQCMLYYLCDTVPIAPEGTALLDIRHPEEACESYLDVCCTIPKKTP